MSEAPKLEFLYRPGCHLCEEMAARLLLGWPHLEARVEWCDVDSDEQLRARWGTEVPVLRWAGQSLCVHVLDGDVVSAHFGPPRFPV